MNDLHPFLELLAVLSSALFGILLARRKGMDFVGVFSVAFCTAFGGGTLRDLFLDRHPLFWIANAHYPVLVFAMALAATLFRRIPPALEHALLVPDAVGMGLFAIVGTAYALAAGTSLFVATLLGVITGTFGGVIGDIICNEVPSLFRPAPLCATCAFTGCWTYVGVGAIGGGESLATGLGIVVTVLFRLAALRWNLSLSALGQHENSRPDS